MKKSLSIIFCLCFILNPLLIFNLYASSNYDKTETLELSSLGLVSLGLKTPSNLGGTINLEVWNQNKIAVEYQIKVSSSSEEKSQKMGKSIGIELQTQGNAAKLIITTPHPALWEGKNYSVRLNLNIFVPKDFQITSDVSYFDFDLIGPLKNVQITSKYGDVYVANVKENLDISNNYGKVDLENIIGDLKVETQYSPIYLREHKNSNGNSYIKSIYAEIDLENVEACLNVETIYSPIYVNNLRLTPGLSKIKTIYSKIDLEIISMKNSELSVSNTYGNVNITAPQNLSAKLLLKVDPGGKIQTTGFPVTLNSVQRNKLEGVVGKGESQISVAIQGIGKIYLTAR